MIKNNRKKRLLCLLLAVLVCAAGWVLPGLTASAAGTPTSIGLAQHGIQAHADGWIYVSGAKGQVYGGSRASDCAGLIYAYYSDQGAASGLGGGATSQVKSNCVFSNDISEGIPNIHGLALTMPDLYDPGSGIYGHIGIYIGNNEAADNSDQQFNMRREPVVGNSRRNWTAWHILDNGMKYPIGGWYALDGKMVHYTNYEYDTDTAFDGYAIGSDGYALSSDGTPAPVDASLLSDQWASASQVAAYLRTRYSGVDSTYELCFGSGGGSGGSGSGEEAEYNGRITGSGVRLRASATTKSAIVTTLSLGAVLDIQGEETGETVDHEGRTTALWYRVTTSRGLSGYVCSLFAEKVELPPVTAPAITAKDGYVTMTASPANADIYYTTDGTQPTRNSTPYVGPLYLVGRTYKAIAVKGSRESVVSTATVLSDSSVFTDLDAGAWYFPAVDRAVEALIFRGNGDGTFSPNKKITRGQFVTALANLDRVDLEGYMPGSSFIDVQDISSRTAKAILWAADLDIIHGYADGSFRPNNTISREEMCVILANYAGIERLESSVPFADDGAISSWARDAVYACRDNELVGGVGQNRFDPKGTATRAQACVITVNFYSR